MWSVTAAHNATGVHAKVQFTSTPGWARTTDSDAGCVVAQRAEVGGVIGGHLGRAGPR